MVWSCGVVVMWCGDVVIPCGVVWCVVWCDVVMAALCAPVQSQIAAEMYSVMLYMTPCSSVTRAQTQWRCLGPAVVGLGQREFEAQVNDELLFVIVWVWQRVNRYSADTYSVVAASGMIVGDGIWTVPSSILAVAGVQPPVCMEFMTKAAATAAAAAAEAAAV